MAWLRKRREDPKVDLTAMVDVVFLLLIFFMISTTFVESPGITVDLPESGAKREAMEPKEVTVTLTPSGEIFLRGASLTLAELKRELAGFAAQAQEMTFVLQADRETRHGRVVELMDLAREAGFGKLAIATEPRHERQP